MFMVFGCLLQVVRDPSHLFMQSDDWKAFVKKAGRFSVRTGIFDCSLDLRLGKSQHLHIRCSNESHFWV